MVFTNSSRTLHFCVLLTLLALQACKSGSGDSAFFLAVRQPGGEPETKARTASQDISPTSENMEGLGAAALPGTHLVVSPKTHLPPPKGRFVRMQRAVERDIGGYLRGSDVVQKLAIERLQADYSAQLAKFQARINLPKRRHRSSFDRSRCCHREQALVAIKQLVLDAPFLAPQAISVLIDSYRSSQWRRHTTAKSLEEIAKATPTPAVFQKLQAACGDTDECVREVAISALHALIAVAPKHTIPVQLVSQQLQAACRDTSERVREGAVAALQQLAKVVPEHNIPVQEIVLKAYHEVGDGRIGHDVIAVLSAMIDKASEQQLKCIQEILLRNYLQSCFSWSFRLKRPILIALTKLLKKAPDYAESVLDAMLEGCECSSTSDVGSLGELVQVMPQHAHLIVGALLKACKDAGYEPGSGLIRISAICALCKLVKVAPQYVESVLEMLIKLARDPETADSVTEAHSFLEGDPFREIAMAAPTKSVLALLIKTYEHKASYEHVNSMIELKAWENVRLHSIQGLAALAEAAPVHRKEVFETLTKACKDDNWRIRAYAVSSFTGMLPAAGHDAEQKTLLEPTETAPDYTDQVLKISLRACSDQEYSVRSAAINTLGRLAQSAPQYIEQVLGSILRACRDAKYTVRIAAIGTLEMLLEIAPPQHKKAIIEKLMSACYDAESGVSAAATSVLEKLVRTQAVSVDQAIKTLMGAFRSIRDDRHDYARNSIARTLGELLKKAPKHTAMVLKALLSHRRSVGHGATYPLRELVHAAPTESMCKALIHSLSSDNPDIRSNSLEALTTLVEKSPQYAQKALEALLHVCQAIASVKADSCDFFSLDASSGFETFIKATPPTAATLQTVLAACEAQTEQLKYISQEAARELPVIVRSIPTPATREALLKAYKSANPQVRSAVVRAFVELVQANEQDAVFVLNLLKDACSDADVAVREAAAYALGQLVSVSEKSTAPALELLKNACSDTDSSVRRTAVRALKHLVRADEIYIAIVLELLKNACSDADVSVREAVVSVLTELLKVDETNKGSVLEILKNACNDADKSVRRTVVRALEGLIKSDEKYAKFALRPLLAMYPDQDGWVQHDITRSLIDIVEEAPFEETCQALLEACRDMHSNARKVATTLLVKLAAAAPIAETRQALLEACGDMDTHVRKAALAALVELVKAAPIAETREALVKAYNNANPYVRLTAIYALSKLAKVNERYKKDLFAILHTARKDRSRGVHRIVKRVLREWQKSEHTRRDQPEGPRRYVRAGRP